MFAIDDRHTYDYAMNGWINWLEDHAKTFGRVLLVGNKKDMKHKREVYYEFASESIDSNPMIQRYIEISCKTNHKIDDLIKVINSYTESDVDKQIYAENLKLNNQHNYNSENTQLLNTIDDIFKLKSKVRLANKTDDSSSIVTVGTTPSSSKCCSIS